MTVTPDAHEYVWNLTDLLGRSMGQITQDTSEWFMIRPDGLATETMAGMNLGPYLTLDDALAAIETHTHGVCRRSGC